MSSDKTKTPWQKLMEPPPPPRRYVSYRVNLPYAPRPETMTAYVISGYAGEVEKEVERLVRAFRAIGEEPTVTRKAEEPVEM